MALRGEIKDIHGSEKVVWLFLVFVLLWIELRAIDTDRIQRDHEQLVALDNQRKGFEAIGEGMKASIAQSQQQFQDTMRSTTSVLNSITGGSSYPVLIPLFLHPGDPNVPLGVENHGDNILTGVTASVYTEGAILGTVADQQMILNSVQNRLSIGTLHVGERLVLGATLHPENALQIDSTGGSGPPRPLAKPFYRLFILLTAQNATYTEYLDFRKMQDNKWEYRYQLYRNAARKPWIPPRSPRERSHNPLLETIDWSQDQNSPVDLRHGALAVAPQD